jgi:hypothetical protein
MSSSDKNKIIGIDMSVLQNIIQQTIRSEIESCLSECRFGTEYKDETWDRATLARFLGISPEKVTELYNKKELPGRKLGREYFFLKSQILNLLQKRRA